MQIDAYSLASTRGWVRGPGDDTTRDVRAKIMNPGCGHSIYMSMGPARGGLSYLWIADRRTRTWHKLLLHI